MDGIYDVMLGDKAIGKMYVDQQGLYLRFRCRCQLTGQVIYKIIATNGDASENLGVLVPMGAEFGLETRVPAKRFASGDFRFQAVPRHSQLREKFIPLSPQEPFAYITQLKNAYLRNIDGQVGIIIQDGE